MTREDEYFTGQSKYCYPDTNILKNKLNIKDEQELEKAERNLTLLRLANLQMYGIPNKNFNFSVDYFIEIHRFLFQDLYDFAGKFRTEEINKFPIMFCVSKFIYENLNGLINQMKKQANNINNEEDLIAYLAYFYGEINTVHPFREGNGRSLREFLRQATVYICDLKNLNLEIDYSNIDEITKRKLINGSILSAANKDITLLQSFFKDVVKEKNLIKDNIK